MYCALWALGPVLGGADTETNEGQSPRSSQPVREKTDGYVTASVLMKVSVLMKEA